MPRTAAQRTISINRAMPTKFTPLLLVLLLLFQYSSLRPVEASRVLEAKLISYPFQKMKARKLEAEIVVHDYDDPGPNPKHDPRKGRPGGGRQ
ncbi:hypothetical protein H6P81_013968 [Aristolochia fimbriata]|uniref:Uncharacterized protein n=1 Tax=Aristolochia fimbriata TaxID=158543 RepID=A0AAV7EG62_ARIFI|nr:hypothetical protein H6P81_013968 [Aristolochia fimbriata]